MSGQSSLDFDHDPTRDPYPTQTLGKITKSGIFQNDGKGNKLGIKCRRRSWSSGRRAEPILLYLKREIEITENTFLSLKGLCTSTLLNRQIDIILKNYSTSNRFWTITWIEGRFQPLNWLFDVNALYHIFSNKHIIYTIMPTHSMLNSAQ